MIHQNVKFIHYDPIKISHSFFLLQ